MSLKIYNTLTRKKDSFTPLLPPKVGMYVCGVTVYDECHLGHARAIINFDVIYRYLRYKGYDVTYVRNFTDVDDKIIDRAKKDNVPWDEIARRYMGTFRRDTQALGVEPPTHEPKATENIKEILDLIMKLLKKEIAYQAGGDIFYSVRKKDDYGKLSGKKIDELEAGARVEILEAKKDPLDFTLWKSSKAGEPSWDSPWGPGRPGWHIECSAMGMRYLGETFDIHGGGRDLMFPHHENEIAQSEGASGKNFVKTWIHNGFVNINAEKMSKSLGNFLTVRDLLAKYHPEVIRLFILSSHYRSPLDYTEEKMESMNQSLIRWYSTLLRIKGGRDKLNARAETAKKKGMEKKIEHLIGDFESSMDDDFNTAKVVGQLFDLIRELNIVLDQSEAISPSISRLLTGSVEKIHSVMGIFGSDPDRFIHSLKERVLKGADLDAEEIKRRIQERDEARKSKDWGKADEIRKKLLESGIQLKDNPDGTTDWSAG